MSKLKKRFLIMAAVKDFYNEEGHDQVARHLMGQTATLTEPELNDCWKIEQNLRDKEYARSL